MSFLLDVLGRTEVWPAHRGRTGLALEDRAVLARVLRNLSGNDASGRSIARMLVVDRKRMRSR